MISTNLLTPTRVNSFSFFDEVFSFDLSSVLFIAVTIVYAVSLNYTCQIELICWYALCKRDVLNHDQGQPNINVLRQLLAQTIPVKSNSDLAFVLPRSYPRMLFLSSLFEFFWTDRQNDPILCLLGCFFPGKLSLQSLIKRTHLLKIPTTFVHAHHQHNLLNFRWSRKPDHPSPKSVKAW